MRTKLLAVSALTIIVFAVFSNSLSGEFVYDDNRQIVRNPLIQDPALYGRALLSDVWAFKGDGTVAASNYWRPTFTAFNIINFQMFGLEPFFWHLMNVFLHLAVCVLIFILLRRWELPAHLSFAAAAIFAVHPVHVESVAWIAGSPDLLFGLFFLGSLWFAQSYSKEKNRVHLAFALVLYAFALGSKEVAFLCFPILGLIAAKENGVFARKALRFSILFFLAAAAFFFVRWMVLGQISQRVDDAAGVNEAFLTVPSAFVFYIKQIVFPVYIGTNYSLRPVQQLDPVNFVLPLFVAISILSLFLLLAKRSRVQFLGLLIFLLPLVPAFNFTAFATEELVHDRYLYLPLLGFLLMVLPYLDDLLKRYLNDRSPQVFLAGTLLISALLGVKSFYSNRNWANDLILWEHNVTIDPGSSANWAQYGAVLEENGKVAEAVEAYNNSLDINPSPIAYLGKARGNLLLKRVEEAVWDLRTVTEMNDDLVNAYTLYLTYEALVIALTEQKKFNDARDVLFEARKRLPIYFAALTEKLAVVNYQAGDKNAALRDLESARNQAKVELLPESKAVLLRLGMLYAETGQKERAVEDLKEYLKLTSALKDKTTLANREHAQKLLKEIQ